MINSGINNTEKKFSGYEQTWLNTYAWSIFYILGRKMASQKTLSRSIQVHGLLNFLTLLIFIYRVYFRLKSTLAQN